MKHIQTRVIGGKTYYCARRSTADGIRRTDFGVVVGNDTYYCARRSTADRIRRVVRLHKQRGGWCGWYTLYQLVELARLSWGHRAATIVDTFERRGDKK